MTIKEIRKLSGMTRAAFAREYNIPLRSIENWEAGVRKCPDYVIQLLEKSVKEKRNICMKTIEIYCNYGVLGSEKRKVYTFGGEHPHATCSDEVTVIVPNGWGIYENQYGETMVSSPWGWNYTVNEVLIDRKGHPAFQALDKDGNPHFEYLYTQEELLEKEEKKKAKEKRENI